VFCGSAKYCYLLIIAILATMYGSKPVGLRILGFFAFVYNTGRNVLKTDAEEEDRSALL
jgi:hypothetical protein